jgi:hypothetical protein
LPDKVWNAAEVLFPKIENGGRFRHVRHGKSSGISARRSVDAGKTVIHRMAKKRVDRIYVALYLTY